MNIIKTNLNLLIWTKNCQNYKLQLLFFVWRQITFVMLNRFCLLSNPTPLTPLFLILMDNSKIDRKATQWKIHTFSTLYFRFWRCSYKNLKIQPPNILFLFVFISFYLSRQQLWFFLKLLARTHFIQQLTIFKDSTILNKIFLSQIFFF